MPIYIVTVPMTGYFSKEIEAESPEAAIDKALAHAFLWDANDVEEWDAHRSIINEDNESEAMVDDASAEDIEEMDLEPEDIEDIKIRLGLIPPRASVWVVDPGEEEPQ